MNQSHTEEAKEYFLDLPDREMGAIWADIGMMPSDAPADLWRKKLDTLARAYSLSSRFALMRILYSRAQGSGGRMTEVPDGGSFETVVGGESCCFRDISLAHAENLTPEENRLYIACLMELAERQADSDPEVNEQLLARAWYDERSANAQAESQLAEDVRSDPKKEKKARAAYTKKNKKRFRNRLTREEALQLGHVLDFSLEEIQWFLLRTLDAGDSLRFNRSEDLVEAYGFLTGASWQRVQRLKEEYSRISRDIEKLEEPARNGQWTGDVSDTLQGRVEVWKRSPESMDGQFLAWMKERAAVLDIPSRTAGRIYRNLAAFAHDLVTGEEIVPMEEDFADCIQDVYSEPEDSDAALRLFYQDGILSEKCCKKAADLLLLENKIQSISLQEDNTKAWHVLGTLDDGSFTPSGGVVNRGRSRVADILAGKLQAEKGDMLYLLWFTANLIWQNGDAPDANTLCCRIIDFMDTAKYLLEAALLPDFYPPHPMEQTMLLSIVASAETEDDPSVVYEYMLHSLTKQRQRKPGSERHDREFKINVVKHYRAHPDLTLEECALLFDISPKTLSAWQKTLLAEGAV